MVASNEGNTRIANMILHATETVSDVRNPVPTCHIIRYMTCHRLWYIYVTYHCLLSYFLGLLLHIFGDMLR